MADWLDSLGPEAKGLIEDATELREAREAAQRAMRRGSRLELEAALARLQAANRQAKER